MALEYDMAQRTIVRAAVGFQRQYGGPGGAEYTVGRVLVESLGAITTRTVRKRGLEPPRPCGHMNLNHARLPIPPLPHKKDGQEWGEILFALHPVKPGSNRFKQVQTGSSKASTRQAAQDCVESF